MPAIDETVVKDSTQGTPPITPVTTSPAPQENVDEFDDDVEMGEEASPVKTENAPETKQRNPDAEAGKISSLQKRVNELEQQKSELDGAMGEIRRYYQEDPKGYEGFRQYIQKSKNIDLGSYEALYGKQTTAEQPTQSTAPKSIDEVKLIARQEFRAEMEAEAGIKEFMTTFPDLDPMKLDDVKKAELKPVMIKVEQMANFLKQQDPSLKMGQAYITAYRALNPDAIIAEAKEQGEVAGRLKELNNGASSTLGASAVQPQQSQSDISFLPSAHRDRYNELIAEGKKELDRKSVV